MGLILRPSGVPDAARKWALQLRHFDGVETEYYTLTRVSEDIAWEIAKAGKTYWLFGPPEWRDSSASSAKGASVDLDPAALHRAWDALSYAVDRLTTATLADGAEAVKRLIAARDSAAPLVCDAAAVLTEAKADG